MKRSFTLPRTAKLTALFYVLAIGGILTFDACHKSVSCPDKTTTTDASVSKNTPASVIQITQGKSETSILTVAAIRKSGDGNSTEVMFNERAQLFSLTDATIITTLQTAFANHTAISVTTNPWSGTVLQVNTLSQRDATGHSSRITVSSPGTASRVDFSTMTDETVDHIAGIAVLNTTVTDSLTSVIPDMASAQIIFDYITHQCCALPGPYAIDYCIPFQYCEDGCYARAHKMCWILNTKYNYATHKVFSFANAGSDELCVKGEKWGGCCVNWWYHVAPLVNIKTAKGVQAYVFDPAMFDQPVLLSAWLHAQQNPACLPSGDAAHVSMINIQPTSSYSPSDYTGYDFDTDPIYYYTDMTLTSYRPLTTCP
jgi:hypothetical protein